MSQFWELADQFREMGNGAKRTQCRNAYTPYDLRFKTTKAKMQPFGCTLTVVVSATLAPHNSEPIS